MRLRLLSGCGRQGVHNSGDSPPPSGNVTPLLAPQLLPLLVATPLLVPLLLLLVELVLLVLLVELVLLVPLVELVLPLLVPGPLLLVVPPIPLLALVGPPEELLVPELALLVVPPIPLLAVVPLLVVVALLMPLLVPIPESPIVVIAASPLPPSAVYVGTLVTTFTATQAPEFGSHVLPLWQTTPAQSRDRKMTSSPTRSLGTCTSATS